MQTFDKIKLDKMVIHAYTKTYYTKSDRFDIEQTFNTQFEATYTILKNSFLFFPVVSMWWSSAWSQVWTAG